MSRTPAGSWRWRRPLRAADALVVVDEIAAPVEDQPAPVELQGARVVRGVPVDDVHAAVDERMGEGDLLAGDRIAPVGPPVDRGHRHIARPLHPPYPLDD